MKHITPIKIGFLGLLIFIFGIFRIVGTFIPPQDPSPELQASWEADQQLSENISSIGFILMLVAIVFALIRYFLKNRKTKDTN